jgi:hypothetical protein
MVNTRERIQAVVNSARRLNTGGTETSSNFTYQFNRSFSRVTEILIQSIQFPFTFYAINSTNNKLIIERGTTNTITIPPGNYTATSLIATLNVILNNATYGGFPGETFVVTFSTIYLKFTITNGNPFRIISETTNPLSTFAKHLGFRNDSILGLSCVGDSAANLVGPQYIRIKSKFFSAPTQHKPLYADNSYSDTLFILPINAGFGSFISTDIQVPIRLTYKFSVNDTDIIDFQIVDENGNELNLNGNDWSMYMVMVTE